MAAAERHPSRFQPRERDTMEVIPEAADDGKGAHYPQRLLGELQDLPAGHRRALFR